MSVVAVLWSIQTCFHEYLPILVACWLLRACCFFTSCLCPPLCLMCFKLTSVTLCVGLNRASSAPTGRIPLPGLYTGSIWLLLQILVTLLGEVVVVGRVVEECFNTLRPRQMDAISQTTFSNVFSWMKMYEFRLTFHWSLFLGVQLTIFQHWFR